MPNPKAQTPKITSSKLIVNVSQPIVCAPTAAQFEFGVAWFKVKLVVSHQNLLGFNLEKPSQRTHGLARQIHECLGLEQPDVLPLHTCAGQHSKIAFVHHWHNFEFTGERINPPKSGIVSGALILWARVAQSDKQFDHVQNLTTKTPRH